MVPVLREAAAIWFWTTWPTFLGAAALAMVFRIPLVITYLLGALTVGPALAIVRGIRRDRDPLSPTGRAVAEGVALLGMMGFGWLVARWLA